MAAKARARSRVRAAGVAIGKPRVAGRPRPKAYSGAVVADVAGTRLDVLTEPPEELRDAVETGTSEEPEDAEGMPDSADASPVEEETDAPDPSPGGDLGGSPFERAGAVFRRPRVAIIQLGSGEFVPILLELGRPVSGYLRKAIVQKGKRLKLVAAAIADEYADEFAQMQRGEAVEITGRLVQEDVAARSGGSVNKFQLSKEKSECVELPDGRVVPLSRFFLGLRGAVNRTDDQHRRTAEQLRALIQYPESTDDTLARLFVGVARDQRIPHAFRKDCGICGPAHSCEDCAQKLVERYRKSFGRLRSELAVVASKGGTRRVDALRRFLGRKGLGGENVELTAVTNYLIDVEEAK